MESWLVRQAHANCYSPLQFASTYLNTQPRDYDLDLLPRNLEAFKLVTGSIDGGVRRALDMTLFSFGPSLVSSANATYRGNHKFSWVTPSSGARRYCPLCFSEDKTAHLRLTWRLKFAPVCIGHKVLLGSECSNCKAPLRPFRINPYYDLKRCPQCGSPLCYAPVVPVDTSEPKWTAVTSLLGLLKGTLTPTDVKWEKDVAELFKALRFIMRFLVNLRRVELEHDAHLSNHSVPLTYQLLGEAWELLQHRESLGLLIKDHQFQFNALTHQTCPSLFVRYRSVGRRWIDQASVLRTAGKSARRTLSRTKVDEVPFRDYRSIPFPIG